MKESLKQRRVEEGRLKDRGLRTAVVLVSPALLALAVSGLLGCDARQPLGAFRLAPSLEDRLPDGGLFSSATQSFLRGHGWLETADEVRLAVDRESFLASFTLTGPDGRHSVSIENFPIDQLVARLHYAPASPPDAFDAYNLMMAEYARNGLSVPVGSPGDSMAHFETTLDSQVPWILAGDYDFVPNPDYRPFRVAVINNCLKPGLWELSATDRAGEIYHGWFTLDPEVYAELVARANGVDKAFAERATAWSLESPRLELDRLRAVEAEVGRFDFELASRDEPVGYSSQDSRQKLGQGFVRVARSGELQEPERLGDLVSFPVRMTEFVEPGKYSLSERKAFDLTFLGQPGGVTIRRVRPRTHYEWRDPERPPDHAEATHLEMIFEVGEQAIVLGNLPVPLLVQQEDYVLHGFGVGVLSASDLAERRRYLIEHGPAPGYAYLAQARDGALYALNSHDTGIEQVFIRTRPFVPEPHWEITITSFERIVDLVKYRLDIPPELLDELRASSRDYVSPLYYTYADDNVR